MSMGKLVKVLGWYDNEWGYSNRMVDFMLYAGKKLGARSRAEEVSDEGTGRQQSPAQIPTLEDLEARSGRSTASGSSSAPTSTCRSSATATTVRITDDFRIRAALPTLRVAAGARRRTSSRPATSGGRRAEPDPKYSMEPVRARLAELAPGVELLENLRFDPGEEGNDPAFVARLVEGIDGYVNDAFGASHRAHASIVGPPTSVPSAMGRLLQREVEVLLQLRTKPQRPFVAVLGGAKVCDKLGVIEALLDIVDALAIGGAMCFTFLAAQGNSIGDSLFEPDQVDTCRGLLADATKPIHLPTDIVGLDADGQVATFGTRLPDGAKGLDIGPGHGGRVRRRRDGRPHRVLERPDGDVRGRALRRRHAGASPRRSPTPRRSPSSAAATRRPRSPSSASTTTSTTCRPAAAPRSSCSSSATCRAWRPSARRRPVAEARQPLISGNWKMHLNHFEAIQTVQKLAYLVPKEATEDVDVSIHPPFTDLRSIQTLIDADDLPFALGAQHCHWEDKGAFTGEVSPAFLAKLDVRYVICGHSERRELFGETDEMVAAKATAIQRHGMTPILCVGETLDEREAGRDRGQGARPGRPPGSAGRSKARSARWSSPTSRSGRSAPAARRPPRTPRRCARRSGPMSPTLTDGATADALRIQYGGSVKASNIAELMAQPDIDGALVGGASLDPDEFARIVQYR